MRLVVDACVLYPSVLREIVIDVAARGVFTPLWSPRILGEWQHAAARLGAEGAAIASGEIAILRGNWPDADIHPDTATEGRLDLPDPADRHVLAAAIDGNADGVMTLNLRDFPRRAMAAEGLFARAPDDLLMEFWLADPAPIEAAVGQAHRATEAVSGRAQPLRALLRRARLPRLGKALDG